MHHRLTPIGLVGFACAVALGVPSTAGAADAAAVNTALTRGADYLQTKQDTTTGSFETVNGSVVFGGNLVPSALAAAGRNAADVKSGASPSLQDALASKFTSATWTAPTTLAQNGNAPGIMVGDFEQAILNGYAAGFDPSRVAANQNLVAQLAALYAGGGYGDEADRLNLAVFGLLALNRVPSPQFLRDQTIRLIRANQRDDGGYGNDAIGGTDFLGNPVLASSPSNVDATSATMASLCEAGVPASDPAVRRAIAYLRGTLVTTGNDRGAFLARDAFAQTNSDSQALAISGLVACGTDPQGGDFRVGQGNAAITPVDYLLSLQDTTATPNRGGFKFDNTGAPSSAANLFSTQDALRGLAGDGLSADPPARAVAGQPRTRTIPTVADGTSVPIALAVDDGAGRVSFCRVTVASGSSLATLLATANGSSSPSGCATGGAFTGGQLSALNGQTGTWTISIDRGGEQVAAGQTVRFGAFVALRRTSSAVPGGGAAAQPAAVQAKTVAAATTAKSLKFSAKKRVVSVPVSCARDNRSCQGTVYLLFGKSTLGRRPFTIAGGKTTKLHVKLYAKQVKRLGRKRHKVKVNVFSRDGNGVASSSTRTVTLSSGK